jgi:hypothetical protein
MRNLLRAWGLDDNFGGGNRHAKSSVLHRLHCGWVSSHLTFRALDDCQDLSQLTVRACNLLANQAPGASLRCTRAVLLGRLRGDIHIISCVQLSSSDSPTGFEGEGRCAEAEEGK